MGPEKVVKDIYLVGDSEMTDPKDCSVYPLNLGELVLIDAGSGASVDSIVRNIGKTGLDPAKISTVILTHCHIDHVGGAEEFRRRFGARLVMHELDALVVERGDNRATGTHWYGVRFAPLPVDVKLSRDQERLNFGTQEVICLHTPGHFSGERL